MFHIKSTRIELYPLPYTQLLLFQEGKDKLDQHMGWEKGEWQIQPDWWESFFGAIPMFLSGTSSNPDHFEWYTCWLIYHKADNRSIGNIGLSGLPDEKGQVMTGYFLDERYWRQGLSSEALACLKDWAFKMDTMKALIADTPFDNIGSQKVLQNNGFKEVGRGTEVIDGIETPIIHWRLER